MWVARDKTANTLCIFNNKPVRKDECWTCNPEEDPLKDCDFHYDYLQIDSSYLPDLKWEDEPIEFDFKNYSKEILMSLKDVDNKPKLIEYAACNDWMKEKRTHKIGCVTDLNKVKKIIYVDSKR